VRDLEAVRQRFADELATGTAQWLDLPYRLRVRFWFRHRIDGVAIWLVGHHHFRAAIAVWRACRMW
jgi:hypothetical protein